MVKCTYRYTQLFHYYYHVFFLTRQPHISRQPFNGGRCLSVCRENWVSANTDLLLLTTFPRPLIHHHHPTTGLAFDKFYIFLMARCISKAMLLCCFCICSFGFLYICFLYFGAFISPRRQKQIMRWALYQTWQQNFPSFFAPFPLSGVVQQA